MRYLLTAAITALSASPVFAATPFVDIHIPYEKRVLPNGLAVIVHEDHKAPLVAIHVVYRVGSRDERPGRTGFAHLFEHLMFNGSEHYKGEMYRALSEVGATRINGMTSNDRTTYFETIPVGALDRVLWLESDRMGHLLGALDQQKLDLQRGVVQNEKREAEDQPYGKVEEVLAANTYPMGHPYSWTVIGSMEDLNAATLADVKEWFQTYYGAANAIVVIAGDVRTDEVVEKVNRYFGNIPAGPALKRIESAVAPMTSERRATLQARVSQQEIHKIWNVPGLATRDAMLLHLAASVLEMNRDSGRLYDRLVRREKLATAVTVDPTFRDLSSQLEVGVILKPGADLRVVERIVDEELSALRRSGPTRDELDLAKVVMYSAYARLESVADKATTLATGEALTGSPDFYMDAMNWIRAAEPSDVRAAAQRWLGEGVFVLELEPLPDHRVAQSDVDRTVLPAVQPPLALHLPRLQHAALSNGLKIALAEQHGAPVVQLALIADAGLAADADGARGAASLAMSMMDKGTSTRNARDITRQLRQLGAAFEASADLDTSFIQMSALKGQLQSSVALFSELIRRPSFPADELARVKEDNLLMLDQQKADPTGAAYQLIPQLIYGGSHAYASPLIGPNFREAIARVSRSDLQSFHKRWIRPDNATLLIVGDATLAEITPILEKTLADWRVPNGPVLRKNIAGVARPESPRVFLIDHPGAEQSQIVAASVAPGYADPDSNALRALNHILGGDFLSRLNMNLREDKHWSYGASASWQRNQGPGLFTVTAAVQTDKTKESMQEIVRELNDVVGTRPPTQEELKSAQDAMTLRLPAATETAAGVASLYASVVAFALPDDYWNRLIDDVKDLTTNELRSAAHKLIHPSSLTWFVIGDLAKIEADVRSLKLGTVTVTGGNRLSAK